MVVVIKTARVDADLAYTVLENMSNVQITGLTAGGLGAGGPFMVTRRIGPVLPVSVAGPAAAAIDAVKSAIAQPPDVST
jgi:hypothetical protein